MSFAIKHTSEHNQEFQVEIIGKNIEVTNSLREFVLDKLAKFENIVTDIIDVHVRLEVNKNQVEQECFLRMRFSHFNVTTHAVTSDLYASIEKAFHRLFQKVRKWKNKIQDHHHKSISMQEMQIQVYDSRDNAQQAHDEEVIDMNNDTLPLDFDVPKIAKSKTRPLKTLTMHEALMKLDLSGDHFLVFRSEEERGLKVIYKRRDGSYGVMTPE